MLGLLFRILLISGLVWVGFLRDLIDWEVVKVILIIIGGLFVIRWTLGK